MGKMSIRQFLDHSGSGGSKREFLSGWKDTKEAAATVWLHPTAGITSIWRHPFPSIEERTDKQTGAKHTEIWNRKGGCWEDEEVLSEQNYRDRDTGERRNPPRVCGQCRTIEWVRDQVSSGKMPWDYPLFTFHATGGETRETVLYSGGIYNAYGAKGVTDAQKAALKEKRIYLTEAWKMDCRAKLEYAFIVVDDADPKKGLQIAVDSQLLGQKMQSAIAKQIKSLGEEEGDPGITPYAFRWEYDKHAQEFGKRYDVVPMPKIAITPLIRQLLASEPPALGNLLDKLNPRAIMARMQKHINPEWAARVPWTDLWGPCIEAHDRHEAERKAAEASGARAPAPGRVPEVGATDVPIPRSPAPARAPAPPAASPPPAPDETTALAKVLRQGGYTGANLTLPAEDSDEAVACDQCGKAIRVDWPRCPHCGHGYPDVLAQQAPAPAKRMMTRAEKLAERNRQVAGGALHNGPAAPQGDDAFFNNAPGPAPAAPAADPAPAPAHDGWGPDDEIPF